MKKQHIIELLTKTRNTHTHTNTLHIHTETQTQFYVEKNMQTPKLSLRFWGLMINGWSKLYVPLKSSQWKISLPTAIQANICSGQSRTSLVLEVLVAERFLQSTLRSSYWSADKSLNLQAEMNFGFSLNALASHTVLLFY